MRRFAFVAALVVLLGACTGGGGKQAGKGTSPVPSGASAAARAQGVTLPAQLPPASIFAGSQSFRAPSPSRYCADGRCADLPIPAPKYIEAPQGSPVLFAVSAVPAKATLEIRTSASAPATTISLTPAAPMVFQPEMAPRSYVLTLVAAYAASEVRWVFGLRVVEPKKKR